MGKIGTRQQGSIITGKRAWSNSLSLALQKAQADNPRQNIHSEKVEGLLISDIELINFSQGTVEEYIEKIVSE